jgi:hypothetical protein
MTSGKEQHMTDEPTRVALAYIEGCGAKRWDQVAALLAPDLKFTSPGNDVTGAPAYLAVLKRLGPVWVRSDVKQVFSAGPEVCVIYDFVSDSAAGAVPLVEWLTVEGGRIARARLFFDRLAFKPASEELARRAGP